MTKKYAPDFEEFENVEWMGMDNYELIASIESINQLIENSPSGLCEVYIDHIKNLLEVQLVRSRSFRGFYS